MEVLSTGHAWRAALHNYNYSWHTGSAEEHYSFSISGLSCKVQVYSLVLTHSCQTDCMLKYKTVEMALRVILNFKRLQCATTLDQGQ